MAALPDAAAGGPDVRAICAIGRRGQLGLAGRMPWEGERDAPRDVLARHGGRIVFVGGGPAVWAAYAPYIRHWDITRLPFDGDADRWFDPRWLVAAAPPGDG